MKLFTVCFSAPWHDHHAGYWATVTADNPKAAYEAAIAEEIGEHSDKDREQTTLIAVFEGRVELLNREVLGY